MWNIAHVTEIRAENVHFKETWASSTVSWLVFGAECPQEVVSGRKVSSVSGGRRDERFTAGSLLWFIPTPNWIWTKLWVLTMTCNASWGGGLVLGEDVWRSNLSWQAAPLSSQPEIKKRSQVWIHESRNVPDYNFSISRVSSGIMQQQQPSENYNI